MAIGRDLGGQSTVEKISLPVKRPLDRYTIENLSRAKPEPGKFSLNQDGTFSFEFSPDLSGRDKKTTTGAINIPSGEGTFPVIIMIRGFVNQEIYETGMGTVRAAEVFSENGFITIAPDFLGYADSSPEAEDIFETRFQTYTAVMSLLASLGSVEKWDGENVFIWAHSNGGQIALTVLATTGKDIPTSLWAPVSVSFPYSILYYSNEAEDKGKFLRSGLADFEKLYNTEFYSFDNYLKQIESPIQIHQGTADSAVPVAWSKALNKALREEDIDSKLYIYPGTNHNMAPAWNSAINRDIAFFNLFLDK